MPKQEGSARSTSGTAEARLPASGTTSAQAMAQLREIGDAPANTSTGYSLAIGDTFDGSIGTNGDHDWVKVTLEAGTTYVFTLYGRGGQQAGVDDTFLSLRNAAGTILTSNDDIDAGNQNEFSTITYTATSTGTYFLDASAAGSETGAYTLSTATNVFTPDQVATLLTSVFWGFSGPIAFDAGSSRTISFDISGLTAAGQQLALYAFEAWRYATGLTFQQVTGAADIVLDDRSTGAFAGPSSVFVDPDEPFGTLEITRSTVNVGTDWLSAYGSAVNTFSFSTYVHEIGHALGLGHAGYYDGSAIFSRDAVYLNDSTQMSVMSYFDLPTNTYLPGSNWEPVTPMIADFLAMQFLYGVPAAMHGGNTVWGANSNVGGYLQRIFDHVFDGVPADGAFWTTGPDAVAIGFTIYDTAGLDLLDVSTWNGAQVIDLRPEGVSDIAGEQGNVVIMRDTIIEDVKSGAGADRITGNSADNVIEAGRGNDTVEGGQGNDTAVINATRDSVTITAVAGGYRIVSTDGTDMFSGIEFFRFSDETVAATALLGAPPPPPLMGTPDSDTLTGDNADDHIQGFGGADRLEGNGGNDSIEGGDGNDQLLGHAGNDTLVGGEGDDNISASDGNDLAYGDAGKDSLGGGLGHDTLYGGADDDVIGGGPGNDLLYGDDGNDNMSGGYGNDSVYGGDGNDTLAGSFNHDAVYGGAGNDSIGGGDGLDTIYGDDGDDTIGGGSDDDLIYGDGLNDFVGGADFIAGGDGNDTLYGGFGNDTLNGGAGDDLLYGGLGVDTFVFNLRNGDQGADRIAVFDNGFDVIRILGVAGATVADRFDALEISAQGQDTVIRYDGLEIVVAFQSPASLTEQDFLFV